VFKNLVKKILSSESKVKIKLAAIAKDEAAYLPEWIHHHIYFGFDEIEIYVNNTTDNTYDTLNGISDKYPVKVVDADFIFKEHEGGVFQKIAYSSILKNAIAGGFSHVLFLDIDEFWTPLDFKQSIKECMVALDDPEIVSFEWAFKIDEDQMFGRPFNVSNLLEKFQLVKTIFKTSLNISETYPHNVQVRDGKYLLADGSIFESVLDHKYAVDGRNKFGKMKEYYILHRVYRSPIEYISMLGQGMRQAEKIGSNPKGIEFKTNRDGYIDRTKNFTKVDIKERLLIDYNNSYELFLEECDLIEKLTTSQEFVVQRYSKVVEAIPNMPADYKEKLDYALANVQIEEVLFAYNKFLKVNGLV